MRAVIQQNPHLLNTLLQQVSSDALDATEPSSPPPSPFQIGSTNPALLRLISENQEAFVNMLNEPADAATAAAAAGGGGSPAGAAARGTAAVVDDTTAPAAGGRDAGGATEGYVTVTQQDREAINRVRRGDLVN